MPDRPPKPAQSPWLVPALVVRDADAALAFYSEAFGFEKAFAMPGPDGKTKHAEMTWHDCRIMFSPEFGGKCQAPITTGMRPSVALYLYCDDVDALCRQAEAAGAEVETPPQDMFWGDRMCTLIDPDGHIWSFATNVADFDPAKAQEFMEMAASQHA